MQSYLRVNINFRNCLTKVLLCIIFMLISGNILLLGAFKTFSPFLVAVCSTLIRASFFFLGQINNFFQFLKAGEEKLFTDLYRYSAPPHSPSKNS